MFVYPKNYEFPGVPIINLEYVAALWKEKGTTTFLIKFRLKDNNEYIWTFSSEGERDKVFSNLLGLTPFTGV